MDLDLRSELTLDRDVRVAKPFIRVAAAAAEGTSDRAANIALNALTNRFRRFLLLDPRSPWFARRVHVDDKGELLISDLYQRKRLVRIRTRDRGNRGNNGPGIGQDRHLGRRCDLLRAGPEMHCAHAGMPQRRTRIDRDDARVRIGRSQRPCMQHSRKLHIDGVARGPRHFRQGIDARNALPDHRKLRIGRERWRFRGADVALDRAEIGMTDAEN